MKSRNALILILAVVFGSLPVFSEQSHAYWDFRHGRWVWVQPHQNKYFNKHYKKHYGHPYKKYYKHGRRYNSVPPYRYYGSPKFRYYGSPGFKHHGSPGLRDHHRPHSHRPPGLHRPR